MTRSGARVLIMGCGGIGGTVAAHLFEQGVDVAAVSRNPLVADAVAAHGFRTRGEQSIGDVRGEVLTHVPDDGRTG